QAPGCRASHPGFATEHVWYRHDAVSQLFPVGFQEKERNKGQKKSLTSLQQLEEQGFSEQSRAEDVSKVKTIQLAVPAKAGMWLTSRQLEKYQDV
uniref:Uncharacterized protein n=1 Tax=Apteryx owenii TaxID=8824 RepID=A0A8B9P4Q2_APTOW